MKYLLKSKFDFSKVEDLIEYKKIKKHQELPGAFYKN